MPPFVETLVNNHVTFLLVLVRVSAFVMVMPFIGGLGVPNRVKALLVFSISLVLLPVVGSHVARASDPGSLVAGLMGETLIGAAIGLGARLLFAAVELGGEFVGIQMGFGIAGVFNPISLQQVQLIGQLQGMFALAIFLVSNAHHVILKALASSFELVPSLSFYPSNALVGQLVRMTGQMFELGIRIALPVIIVLLLVNVALGVLARVVPQVNVLLLSFPITIFLGLLVMGLSMSLFAGIVQSQANNLDSLFYNLLTEMQSSAP